MRPMPLSAATGDMVSGAILTLNSPLILGIADLSIVETGIRLQHGRIVDRRDARHAQHEAGALPEDAGDRNGAAKLLGDQVEHDIESEPGAALAAAGGDEGVE